MRVVSVRGAVDIGRRSRLHTPTNMRGSKRHTHAVSRDALLPKGRTFYRRAALQQRMLRETADRMPNSGSGHWIEREVSLASVLVA